MRLVLNCVGLEPGEGLGAAFAVAAANGIEWLELFHGINWTGEDLDRSQVGDKSTRGVPSVRAP